MGEKTILRNFHYYYYYYFIYISNSLYYKEISHTLSMCYEGLNLRSFICKSMSFIALLDPLAPPVIIWWPKKKRIKISFFITQKGRKMKIKYMENWKSKSRGENWTIENGKVGPTMRFGPAGIGCLVVPVPTVPNDSANMRTRSRELRPPLMLANRGSRHTTPFLRVLLTPTHRQTPHHTEILYAHLFWGSHAN